MMGEENDLIPVRDTGKHNAGLKADDHDAQAQRAAQQRRMVAKWTREDLEDKYLRMYEENIILKKHARKQEDKIKRMATKLLRLVSDKKKASENQGKKTRDIETEEMLEELHGKIRELERQKEQLKERLMVAKQQLGTQGTRKTNYPHVQSRINTGMHKTAGDPRLTKSMRVTGPAPPRTAPGASLPRYGHSLLEESRAENKHLEDVIGQQNEQINIYEQDIEMLKEQMRVREAGYEEDLLKIKQQMSIGQRAAVQENIDIIRLQREVKEKSSKLIQIQAQYSGLEEKLRAVRASHDQVMSEMERAKTQLMEEQGRRLAVESELRMGTTSQRALVEYQERIQDLEKECSILKTTNDKLVSSAFDLEREREFRQKENALKVQVAQLEATLRADVGEKGSILDKLTIERETYEKLEEEHKELRVTYFQLKQDHDELREKMQFFTQESAVDFQEIEEALMIVKQRKERENQDLDFLHKAETERGQDQDKLLLNLQAEHADTINELEKTRNMLITQHKINRDYQMEVDDVTRKMEENKQEYDTRQQELAQLLDLRAVRIRKLESQLRDVAYGTRQYRIRPVDPQDEDEDLEDLEETISLERGQNLFEIHIKKVSLSPEALRIMGDDEPSVFGTWEFYEFEIQSTPVLRSAQPEFSFTSQYTVKVDDFFLHYLQKDSCTLELHQSFGTDYRTMAACQLSMRDILDRSQGRLHGNVMLTGVAGEGEGINFGVVEYWVRLKVPMEQALRLYKERSKALGYIQTNLRAGEQALEALDSEAATRPPDNVNTLHVNVIRCSKLVGRREGVQPSPYCVYKFFDFTDHDTTIVEGSNNPEYNDHKSFPVPMTADLDRYLKAQPLSLFVFDDTDPEEAVYLGLAKIPLIPLAHDKPIQGLFELTNRRGEVTGTIQISIKWQFSYLPPKASTKTLAQMRALPDEAPESVHLLPGEEESLHSPAPASSDRLPASQSQRPPRPRGPAATSTPLQPVRRQPMAANQPLYQDPVYEEEPTNDTDLHEGSDASVVTEGSPVPVLPKVKLQFSISVIKGESEPMSTASESSTAREPPMVESRPPPPSMTVAAKRARAQRAAAAVEDEEERTPEQLIAEELGEQLEEPVEDEALEDTMFEDPNQESDEAPTDLEEEVLSDGLASARSGVSGRSGVSQRSGVSGRSHTSGRSLADSEDSEIVMASPSSRPASSLANNNPADHVLVTISELAVDEDSPLLLNQRIKMVYVEYTFLGVPREETETPYSLPKPTPSKPISFNFTKKFHVDFERNYDKRQYLASMLLPDDPEEGRIRFTVVAEPDDPDDDCEDVGVAFADLRTVMTNKRDIEDEDVPILDVHDESIQIGTMRLTVNCLRALEAVHEEMGTDTSMEA